MDVGHAGGCLWNSFWWPGLDDRLTLSLYHNIVIKEPCVKDIQNSHIVSAYKIEQVCFHSYVS